MAEVDLRGQIDAVRSFNAKLADAVEPLIADKLEILQSTGAFVDKLNENEVECPACGQTVPVDAFQAHVKAEQERLHEITETFKTRKGGIGTLCDTINGLKVNLGRPDVESWRDELAMGPLADSFAHLDGINAEALRASCGEDDLRAFESKLQPLIDAAASASKDAPPDAQQLSVDKQMVQAGRAVIGAIEQAEAVARAEALVSFIKSLEEGIREEIRLRSQKVIDEISSDIRAMWTILHPGEAIEEVRLYGSVTK